MLIFVRRTSPVPTMKITGRDGRNRELPEDDDSLQERGDCNPDSIKRRGHFVLVLRAKFVVRAFVMTAYRVFQNGFRTTLMR
jgi:hypothetical protein